MCRTHRPWKFLLFVAFVTIPMSKGNSKHFEHVPADRASATCNAFLCQPQKQLGSAYIPPQHGTVASTRTYSCSSCFHSPRFHSTSCNIFSARSLTHQHRGPYASQFLVTQEQLLRSVHASLHFFLKYTAHSFVTLLSRHVTFKRVRCCFRQVMVADHGCGRHSHGRCLPGGVSQQRASRPLPRALSAQPRFDRELLQPFRGHRPLDSLQYLFLASFAPPGTVGSRFSASLFSGMPSIAVTQFCDTMDRSTGTRTVLVSIAMACV